MDLDYGGKRYAVFPYALALLNNPSNNQKGDAEPQMDGYFSAYTNRHGNWNVFYIYDRGQTDLLLIKGAYFKSARCQIVVGAGWQSARVRKNPHNGVSWGRTDCHPSLRFYGRDCLHF